MDRRTGTRERKLRVGDRKKARRREQRNTAVHTHIFGEFLLEIAAQTGVYYMHNTAEMRARSKYRDPTVCILKSEEVVEEEQKRKMQQSTFCSLDTESPLSGVQKEAVDIPPHPSA